MREAIHDAELVADEELVFDDAHAQTLVHREKRVDTLVREGEVLAGKYRVERIPGRSGLGIVVQVRHLELGQEVSLKFLIPDACAYPEFVQRFIREARAAVKIGGEHVARVTDVGRLDSGAPYMVRELLRGPDLAEVLKVRGPLPVSEAVDYVIQAAEGVAEGHALGIVHRNLRPTTLVVTRRSDGSPLVKVFDFAAAETLHVDPFTERAVSLVGTSAIMASLPYLSPEQIRDPHDVDVRADVYALGAILHELLTGSAVYRGDSAPSLLASVAADAAPAVRDLRPELPGELDHIVLRCLAKNRAIRYPTLAELVTALGPFASGDSASAIERVQRLARQTALTAGQSKPASAPSPAANRWSAMPAATNGKSREPTGTLVMSPLPAVSVTEPPIHDDVTLTQPLASDDITVAQPMTHFQPAAARVLTPPPPRSSRRAPPVLPNEAAPAAGATGAPPAGVTAPLPPPPIPGAPAPSAEGYAAFAPAASGRSSSDETVTYAAPHLPPPSQTRTTMMPPRTRRSSIPSGISRSWIEPPEDPQVAARARRRRLVALGVVAAALTLIGVSMRSGATHAPAPPAAAAKPLAAVAPPPAPAAPPPALEPEPATAAAAASAQPSAAPGPAQPVAAAAATALAPARPAAAPAAPPARAVAPARRPPAPAPASPRAETETPSRVAAAKLTPRPAGGDLFDSPE